MFKPSINVFTFAVSLVLTLAFSQSAFALKKCDTPTKDVMANVQMLAGKTGLEIERLEQEWAAQGKELKVVILARDARRNMSMFDVLDDRVHALYATKSNPEACKPLTDAYMDGAMKDFLNGQTERGIPLTIEATKKQPAVPTQCTHEPITGKKITLFDFKKSDLYKRVNDECKASGADRVKCVNNSITSILLPHAEGERKKMEFFHIGLAFKNHPDTDPNAGGKWKVVHMLKPNCQPAGEPKLTKVTCAGRKKESCIYQEKMVQFFLDNPRTWHSLVLVPDEKLQDELERVVIKTDLWANFRSRKYNATARAFHGKPNDKKADQNSNQTILEWIAAAQDASIKDRKGAQELLMRTGYVPSKLNLDDHGLLEFGASEIGQILTGTLKIASLGNLDVRATTNLRGHKLKSKGLIELISARSVRNYLEDSKFEGRPMLAQQSRVVLEDSNFEVFYPGDFDLRDLTPEERELYDKAVEKQNAGEAIFR